MSKVLVNDTNLTNIANAIRGKNGSTDTYKPSEMAAAITAISGGGSGPEIPDSAFVLSGNCSYWDYRGKWDSFIEAYKNKWSTSDVLGCNNMFNSSKLSKIPFDINFGANNASITSMFDSCSKLIELPKLINLKPNDLSNLFNNCYRLRTIPNDFMTNWDWSYLESQTSQYNGNQSRMFYQCYSLRSIPIDLISHGNPYIYPNYSYFSFGFNNCYVLDELISLPIPYTKATFTSNVLGNTFYQCIRLKNVTFAKQEDGTPITVTWKSQTIDLSVSVGYGGKTNILNYNSGITADKEVTDDATYAALKDDPDWFTCDVAYSRYNHDSAVATINSLPDTSAYLATAGGTNTIKFKSEAGSATDGGAINTLTEEEIAVATAKGWTAVYA